MRKIAIVVSSPMTINAFLTKQIMLMSTKYKVTLIANFSGNDFKFEFPATIELFSVKIERKISVLNDLAALFQLFFYFRKRNFFIVHSITPKAGLLAMCAAFCAGIKYRIHTFTGQVWATKTGPSRDILRGIDKLIATLATNLLVDSQSQRKFLIANNVIKERNSLVLCDGSISGVDLARFKPSAEHRKLIRKNLNIHEDDILLLFLGRINEEKGIIELIHAFKQLTYHYDPLKLSAGSCRVA